MEKDKISKINIKNRKASYEYEFLEEFECGIKLLGTEVKSIRNGDVNISDAYCYINNKELFVKNMHISELKNAVKQHEPLRERKLLITKKEINRIEVKLKNKGITLVATNLYSKKGLIKVKIFLAKGKKKYDKSKTIKENDIKRETNRELIFL